MKLRTRLGLLAGSGVIVLGAAAIMAPAASASTPQCSAVGPACGDNVNAFGNAWDVAGQKAALDTKIIAYPNSTADPATDFIRTGPVPAGPFRYEYAPRGVHSGFCVSDPGGGDPGDLAGPDGIELRGCNTGNFQRFRPGKVNGSGGAQLVNVATNLPVQTNGTRAQLTGGGSYAGGSYWKWLGGPVAGSTQMSFRLYANNDSVATCSGGHEVLDHGTAAGTSAQVDVVNPPADAPATAPGFTTDKEGAGAVRWVILFHNGQILNGSPDTAADSTNPADWTWNAPLAGVSGSYMTALAAAQAGGSDDWVTAAFIVYDASANLGPVTLTDVQYNGQHFSC
jgi:hypothetical protein